MIPVPIQFTEGALTFTFGTGWAAIKYDDGAFYKRHFQALAGGCKAVDFMAFKDRELWLIEVKDYRIQPRTKASDLFDELAIKVRDSLAGLVAANSQTNPSGDTTTQDFAKQALRSFRRLRIAFHLEQPTKPSKLFPQVIDPKTARDVLQKSLRYVDPHAITGNKDFFNGRGVWTVT